MLIRNIIYNHASNRLMQIVGIVGFIIKNPFKPSTAHEKMMLSDLFKQVYRIKYITQVSDLFKQVPIPLPIYKSLKYESSRVVKIYIILLCRCLLISHYYISCNLFTIFVAVCRRIESYTHHNLYQAIDIEIQKLLTPPYLLFIVYLTT